MFEGPDGYVLTWQPYELDSHERELLQEYCTVHGLNLRVKPWHTWRYPGWSVLVVVGWSQY